MTITPDTNMLVRLVMEDDREQLATAQAELAAASRVALSLAALCELSWVLSSYYRLTRTQLAEAIGALGEADNVVVDRGAVEVGLTMLARGGDFADGVIASQGAALGGETFVSFDRRAVRLLKDQGLAARAPQQPR